MVRAIFRYRAEQRPASFRASSAQGEATGPRVRTFCGVWYGTLAQPTSRPYPPRLLTDPASRRPGMGGQDHTPPPFGPRGYHTIPRKKLEPWAGCPGQSWRRKCRQDTTRNRVGRGRATTTEPAGQYSPTWHTAHKRERWSSSCLSRTRGSQLRPYRPGNNTSALERALCVCGI